MVVSLYAGLLALLYFRLSKDVIRARRHSQTALGVGDSPVLLRLVSAHSNFAAYATLLLLLLFLVESSGLFPNWAMHVIGAVFTAGRLMHYVAFCRQDVIKSIPIRFMGMVMTLMPLVVLAVLNIAAFFLS